MTDWLEGNKTTSESDAAIKSELQTYMSGLAQSEREEEQSRRDQVGEKLRLYNLYHMRALENALKLGTSRPSRLNLKRVPGRLKVDEFRYAIELWKVQHASAVTQTGALRQCIKTLERGEKRYELPRTFVGGIEIARPTLPLVADMGPKQFPSLQWLMECYNIRGVVLGDFFHQDWNSLWKSLSKCCTC
eukprot:3215414-Amphidinium_carterae.1